MAKSSLIDSNPVNPHLDCEFESINFTSNFLSSVSHEIYGFKDVINIKQKSIRWMLVYSNTHIHRKINSFDSFVVIVRLWFIEVWRTFHTGILIPSASNWALYCLA